jgi:hypothetical protein
MVRAYANVLGLSRALARAGIVNDEAQALLEFTTAFTRAQDLFDFVDAGTKKESSDFKIRGREGQLKLQDIRLREFANYEFVSRDVSIIHWT